MSVWQKKAGNMVSPASSREDALIMWKDPVREAARG